MSFQGLKCLPTNFVDATGYGQYGFPNIIEAELFNEILMWMNLMMSIFLVLFCFFQCTNTTLGIHSLY